MKIRTTQEGRMDVTMIGTAGQRPKADHSAALMEKAKQLETAFLAEMLGHAGMDADETSAFGGGHGEGQFASFLRQEQARMMVEKGGIGLAEALFRAMGGDDAQA
jgi:peptidoglycan hydrolase FlgJ